MLVALTGTPGTGKSSVAKYLGRKFEVIDLNELVREKKLYTRVVRGSMVVDLRRLRRFFSKGSENVKIVVGHLSHLLNVDMAIVLRTNPKYLRRRLRRKGFDERKIEENVEAELIDYILSEAVSRCPNVYEIDTTGRRPRDVAKIVEMIIEGKCRDDHLPGKIDWSYQI